MSERGIRLQLYLARCGIGSRRKCEAYIARGRVRVNDETVTAMGVKVNPDDTVSFDGAIVHPSQSLAYFALHKPKGYLCSVSDKLGRPLAGDLLKGIHTGRLFHAGRLDFLSSGIIFYTNDGAFARVVTHPSAGIEKEYLVETDREIDEEFLDRYRRGLRVGGEVYRIARYLHRKRNQVSLVLTTGKNREIREAFASQRYRVKRVHRIRIGPITVAGLAPGRFRALSRREVEWFLAHGRSH